MLRKILDRVGFEHQVGTYPYENGRSDVVVPVLRTVTVKGEHGSYVSKNFERPHYVPVNKKIFDTISINIREEAGDLVAFEHGKVIITLHFRRSKTQYFIYNGFTTLSFKFRRIL